MAQRHISQLLVLGYSHCKTVTSKEHLKEMFGEKKRKNVYCVVSPPTLFYFIIFFLVHDITGLGYFGIAASQ